MDDSNGIEYFTRASLVRVRTALVNAARGPTKSYGERAARL